MTKRKMLARDTKKSLLAAACALLAEKGFEAINVEEITKAANVSKGTFYTYFKRKEDIVLEISRAPFRETMDEIARMENADLVARLSCYFEKFVFNFQRSGIHICRQWAKEVLTPPNVKDSMDGTKWFYDFGELKKLLQEAVCRGELSATAPVETITQIFISELYGLMTGWCMSDGKFNPVEHIQRIGIILLQPILKPYLEKENEIS